NRKDKEKENKKEKEKENEQEEKLAVGSPGAAFRFYEDNIGPLVPHVAETISFMINDSSEELVTEALRKSVLANSYNKIKYAEGILRRWNEQRLKSLDDVLAADKEIE